ncbi:MAG: phytoene/squalene synthase family protein [Chloroflexota bacterium]
MPNLFRTRARTFWFAAHFLPHDRRPAVVGLYEFARLVDDLVDDPPPTYTRKRVREELNGWRTWLEHSATVTPPDQHLAARVAPALLANGVPTRYLQMLVDGVASDIDRTETRDWSELREYCIQVASSVGLAMCYLLGVGDDPFACAAAMELGIAMQLTNILRDVGADLALGRVYLPTDEMAAQGLLRDRLGWLAARVAQRGGGAIDNAFREFIRSQVARAREHYARGLEGLWHLPSNCQLSILLAGRLYRAILDDVERANYDVFTRRAATSTWHKVSEAARCSVAVRRPSRAPVSRSNVLVVQR